MPQPARKLPRHALSIAIALMLPAHAALAQDAIPATAPAPQTEAQAQAFYEQNKERLNIRHVISSIQVPILICHGTTDAAVPVANANATPVSGMPRSRSRTARAPRRPTQS